MIQSAKYTACLNLIQPLGYDWGLWALLNQAKGLGLGASGKCIPSYMA